MFFRRFLKSLRHAMRGIRLAFMSEHSFRFQVLIGTGVIVLMVVFRLRPLEAVLLLLLIGAVLVLELLNSIFERLVDAFKPRMHPIVKDMKDLMAGAVLVSSLVAATIGTIIFLPHIFAFFFGPGS